ncbi:hypothetical protein CFOL_v3_04443 [Cephalotus follicularis]|uniref:Peptidase A1 domain-containing protein n=1 Tax=Cephalotus follicularis TaxID=3775 RepID=A0A1Q3AZ41_CEPFO|nr:hypothetical protein CFOL_v3_04443 [Cephalotus follicularis]
MFIGGGPYYLAPYGDISTLLVETPLIKNPVSTAPVYMEGEPSHEYFIGVRSIKVDGTVVHFNTSLLSINKGGVGGTKISTITPYTVMHTSIYKALINNFAKNACGSSKTIASARTGPVVPTIDLMLQGKSSRRNYGTNSMVKMKEDVMCLAIIDGGAEPRTSIVMDGLQLEENLFEFDLASSKLGFSSSLLLKNTSCSQQRLV